VSRIKQNITEWESQEKKTYAKRLGGAGEHEAICTQKLWL
jgi:hypothetical protein